VLHTVGIFTATPRPLSWFFSNHKRFVLWYYFIFRRIFKSFHQAVYPVRVTTNCTCNFWKSHMTLLFFIQSQQKLYCTFTVPLLYAAFQISKKSTKACVSYFFWSVQKEKEKINTKKIRQTLKAHTSVMDLFQLLEWKVPHPKGICTAKMAHLHLGITELWIHENGIFLVSV